MSFDKFGVPDDNNAITKPIQPKLGFKFRVFFTGIANTSPGVSDSIIEVTRNIIDCTLPSVAMEPVVIDSYNSRYYVQGKHTYEPITINLRNDIAGEVSKVIGAQFAEQFNPYDQTHAANAGSNKFEIKIQALDGGNSNTTANTASLLQTWHMSGCWISAINWGNMNYTESSPVQIALTIHFDNVFNSVLSFNNATQTDQDYTNSIESTVNTKRYDPTSNSAV